MNIGRPATKSQPSRKGKKAWRKNIDIDDVEKGLEDARELERTTGLKDIQGADEGELFTVDTTGDKGLKPRKMREAKPLKATEILERRSAVPALESKHKKKQEPKAQAKAKGVEGVSGKEINRLMRVAGRLDGQSSMQASMEGKQETNASYDIWGDGPAAAEPPKSKKNNKNKSKDQKKNYSFLTHLEEFQSSHQKATKEPETLKHAPINFLGDELAKALAVPEGGKSYNPDEQEWMDLLKKEHEREQAREDKRKELEAEKERIEEVMRTLPDTEIDGEDAQDEESESDDEPVQDSELISINAPVKVKTKSRQQRAKQKRHQQQLELHQRVKDIKQQIRDLHNLPKLIEAEMAKLKQREAEREAAEAAKAGQKRKKKLGKYHIKDEPLEMKLSDELTSTLRRLKPEGNLAADRFTSLQRRGLIEARVPVAKRRRYAQKVTEKWTYKDFK